MYGLTSDTIGCVPKLMSNQELIALGQKIFNVLPGTRIGAKGYMGARIQPNSPTDHPEDVVWQVFDAFSYATGDIVIGTNPVDSTVDSVVAVERALKDVVDTFKLEDVVPWCVLSHIDVQAEVGESYPGTVATMFQSLAGTDDCNKTFDVTVEKILKYATSKQGQRYGLYFETGQGSEFTNGAANGVDMMVLESRKYGFSRAVGAELAKVQPGGAWLHVNDVAGFIGPGGLQEPRAIGAVLPGRHRHGQTPWADHRPGYLLHAAHVGQPGGSGLVPGPDHAGQSRLPDCAADQERPDAGLPHDVVPGSRPAEGKIRLQGQRCDVGFLQADRDCRPDTTNTPRTTAIRSGCTTSTAWPRVTQRSKEAVYAEGRQKMKEVEARGVDLATGHGEQIWDLNPQLAAKVNESLR